MAKNTETRAVCLVSGGLDSCVSAALARREYQSLTFLHLSYGQRTAEKELSCFRSIAKHYNVTDCVTLSMQHIRLFGGSSLLDNGPDVPCAASSEEPIPDGVPSTYVPFRNGTMLAIAAALAEVRQARAIYVGAVEEDSSGYPDCRQPFFKAFEKAVNLGTGPDTSIEIKTPVIHKSKKEIILLGTKLDAPLHLTWSCYCNETKACGRCESCRLRLRAFRQAGLADPVPYEPTAVSSWTGKG